MLWCTKWQNTYIYAARGSRHDNYTHFLKKTSFCGIINNTASDKKCRNSLGNVIVLGLKNCLSDMKLHCFVLVLELSRQSFARVMFATQYRKIPPTTSLHFVIFEKNEGSWENILL